MRWLGFFVIVLVGVLSIWSGMPALWSPHSSVTSIFVFLVAASPAGKLVMALPAMKYVLYAFAALPLGLLFLIWFRNEGVAKISVRSAVCAFVVSAASVCYFIDSWSLALVWHGTLHAVTMAVFSGLFSVSLFGLYLANRKNESSSISGAFDIVLFGWLAWCAFPSLGELM